nr:reverse transcriptase domain-containing protein [Tanacetum cinerariifolium]
EQTTRRVCGQFCDQEFKGDACKKLGDEVGASWRSLITWLVIKWVKIEGKRALETQAATMANADNANKNPEPREAPIARKYSYKEFMTCQPFNFKGLDSAIGLIRWFEHIELVFSRSNYTKDCKVKFATGTLTEEALSWWNSCAQPIRMEEAYKITWVEFKKLLIKKYCPQIEIQKMEHEFYHLTMKGNDFKTYKSNEKRLEDIPVAKEFPNVFPEDIPGLPLVRQVEFLINLILGTTLIARAPYRLAPSEMYELSNQLQELID